MPGIASPIHDGGDARARRALRAATPVSMSSADPSFHEQWRRLIEQVDDLFFSLDDEGRFTAVNAATERAFGLSRADLLTRTLADVVEPDSQSAVLDLPQHAARAVESAITIVRVSADGRPSTFELTARPARDGDRRPGVHVIGRDVTARRAAEDALRESEQRFRLLAEHGADGTLLVSAEGRIFFASRPVTRWLGYAPADLLGRDLNDFLHPDDRDRVGWALAEAIDRPATATLVEYRCRHRDGTWRIHEATLVNHLDQAAIAAIVVAFRDVTDSRNAESALHESEQRFRAVFESPLIGIIRASLDGRILEVNQALVDISGLARVDLVGRHVTEFVHADDMDAAVTEWRLLASGQRVASRTERRYVAASGRELWVNVTSTLVRDESGAPQYVLTILENITERKQTEAELRESNTRLSVWVQQLEQRTREIGLLSDMGDLLRACRSAEEACSVIVPMATRLFPGSTGIVSLVGDGTSVVVDPVARWGSASALELFGIEDCWALRRGRPHVVMNRREGPLCRHLQPLEGEAAICVPMMAHGELLGVLSLVVGDAADLTDPRQRLVTTVSEHVSLALANLKLEESLRRQSIRDPLTGLFNRRYMEESLEREMRRASRNRTPVGIIMIDLDLFKAINDAHGHDAGDVVLRAVGTVLQRSIRAEDIACRYGGEEFILILPDATSHDAAQRADALRQAVKQIGVSHRRQPLPPITISAGVANYPEDGPSTDAVLRAADAALYHAKTRGRDLVVVSRTGGLFPDSLVEFVKR